MVAYPVRRFTGIFCADDEDLVCPLVLRAMPVESIVCEEDQAAEVEMFFLKAFKHGVRIRTATADELEVLSLSLKIGDFSTDAVPEAVK